jgi:hypothetical protein
MQIQLSRAINVFAISSSLCISIIKIMQAGLAVPQPLPSQVNLVI